MIIAPPFLGLIHPKLPPVWIDTFDLPDADTVISNGDSSFSWMGPIILTAGTALKLRLGVATDPFLSSIRGGLYDGGGNLIASASAGASAVGWNELTITPVVVTAGSHTVILKALANADLEWAGKTGGSVNLNFGDVSYFAPFPATIPATDFSPGTDIAAGVYVLPVTP